MELDDVLSDKDGADDVSPVVEPVVVEKAAELREPAAPVVKADDPAEGSQSSGRKEFKAKERAAQEEGRARLADGTFAPKDVADTKAAATAVEDPKEPVVDPKPEPKPAPEQMTAKERALLAAAQDERTKRRAAELRIAELTAAQPPADAATPKTFWDDPEAALGAFEQRIAQQNQQHQLNAAEIAARARHPDFDQMLPIFGEMLQENPGLARHWLASPDPAEYAYRAAKSLKELRDAGSVDAIKAQAVKEARITFEAEQKAKQQALEKERAALPDTLSSARGGSGGPRVAYTGPTSLDSILSTK